MKNLSRRDFLKLLPVFTGSILAAGSFAPPRQDQDRPNIIIILFDAMSATNLSLYGYPRETSPFLSAFAERSTVYHTHYSAGSFTTPGVASMLTGMLPWKHRAINQGGLINQALIQYNPFTMLGSDYFRLAFSQNPWPDHLIGQFYNDVDRFLPRTAFSLHRNILLSDKIGRDRSIASIVFDEFLFSSNTDITGSSILGHMYKNIDLESLVVKDRKYPGGLPQVSYEFSFMNEEIYYGVLTEIRRMESLGLPYFSYFHLYSPHFPYRPNVRYSKLFHDNFSTPAKPVHPFTKPGFTNGELLTKRTRYDQQVAHVDGEFGNLIIKLDEDGILDRSYVIVTSDHGEMFERGYFGHSSMLVYEPVIRIPLLIHSPRQTKRRDIFTQTGNVDLLPTLLSITGGEIPPGLDGKVLPGFGGTEDDRVLFSMDATKNSSFTPIKKGVISMRRGPHKLISYLGFSNVNREYELYNLEDDPDELQDLTSMDEETFSKMKQEFLDHLSDVNKVYS